MSVFFIAMVTIQLKDVPPQQTPSATGLSNFARITAGGFAASLTTAFWDRREALHQTAMASAETTRLNEWSQALSRLQTAGASSRQAVGALTQQVINQAYTIAALDLFWLFGVLSVLMIPLIWIARRSMGSGGPAAAD
jgi:DHA2 family multidrug resistance protein